jgi:PAS domain S-box-containing protein
LHTVSILKDETGKDIGLLGVGKDITERRKAETMLQGSELFYRNLISDSLDGIVMINREGKITYCAPSVTKLYGYEPQHLLSHSIYEFIHPADIDLARNSFFAEVHNQSKKNGYVVIRLKHSNNNWVWCIVRGHSLLENPAFNAVVVYFTDDSRRKETENKLKESEEQFRHLLNNLSTGVLLLDISYKIVMCNKAGYTLLGLPEDDLLNRSIFDSRFDIVHEDGTLFLEENFPVVQSRNTGKAVSDVVMGIYNPKIDGKAWLLVNAEPVFNTNNEVLHVICSFSDITEQKRLSQELVEQEVHKQKQLTQAAIDGQENERQQIGKELHDNINQHLTTTRLYLEVAKEKATGELQEIITHSHKNLVSIINEIRQLSQSLVPPTLGDIGFIESIQDLCDSLRRVHTLKIDFYYRHFNEQKLPDNLKLMLFRITQEQINNILRHADARLIQIKLQSDAEHIMLSIVDDGKGFNLATTKKGQGFNNITNRAALFNGKAEIEAAPGKGCSLTVIIPVPVN